MAIRVKITDIIDALDSQSFDVWAFLNKNTGEIMLIGEEEKNLAEENELIDDLPDWQKEAIKFMQDVMSQSKNCIALPTKFDIHEYGIMKKFCADIEDEQICEIFEDLIQGSGAFGRFKDAIDKHGIANDWYAYRTNALKEIAIEWCRENNIEFEDIT